MLPLGKPYSRTDLQLSSYALSIGYDSVWFQDWPVGVGDSETIDHGTGHDPLIYASHFPSLVSSRPKVIGLAALRLDFRTPAVTARSLVSVSAFTSSRLIAGFGAGTYSSESLLDASRTWRQIREYLYGNDKYFIKPPGYVPPEMFLASSQPSFWREIDYNAEGWMTFKVDPRKIYPLARQLQEHASRDIKILVALYADIDTVTSGRLQIGERGQYVLGVKRLSQLAKHWKSAGVTHLVFMPSRTPTVEEIETFLEATTGA